MVRLSAVRSRSMKRTQEEGEEVVFLVSRPEFESNRSGRREWWHNGLLYDIKSIRREGDSLRVTARADRHEQVLLRGFQQIFQQSGGLPAGNVLSKLLAQFLAAPFLQTELAWTLQHPGTTAFKTPFATPLLPDSRKPDISSPPPEMA